MVSVGMAPLAGCVCGEEWELLWKWKTVGGVVGSDRLGRLEPCVDGWCAQTLFVEACLRGVTTAIGAPPEEGTVWHRQKRP